MVQLHKMFFLNSKESVICGIGYMAMFLGGTWFLYKIFVIDICELRPDHFLFLRFVERLPRLGVFFLYPRISSLCPGCYVPTLLWFTLPGPEFHSVISLSS